MKKALILGGLWLLSLIAVHSFATSPNKIQAKARELFEFNRHFHKGGIGLLPENCHVLIDSPQNELVLEDGARWQGAARNQHQMVVLFDKKCYSTSNLPADFKLARCAIVSFEGEKIFLFDFKAFQGGYYER
jgi:hypothetical protein